MPLNAHKAQVTVLKKKTCTQLFPTISNMKTFCTGSRTRGSAKGDSGGSFTYYGIIYGIIIASNHDDTTTVLTDVAHYLPWVESIKIIHN